jgi:hypothetical protein
MSAKPNAIKTSTRSASKHLSSKIAIEALQKRDALKPWLDLANQPLPKEIASRAKRDEAAARLLAFIKTAPDAPFFPADSLRAWFARTPTELERQGGLDAPTRLLRLVRNVRQTLHFRADETAGPFLFIEKTDPIVHGRSAAGRPTVEKIDPYRDYFLVALESVEPERVRVCPICKRYFYAPRVARQGRYDASTKGCRPECANLIRVRRFRESAGAYEYNRKLKTAGLKPERKAKR